MAYPIRKEDPEEIYFITTRTLGSRLWFVNNKSLEYMILAFLAKYAQLYEVNLYAFVLMGNHYHLIAQFPKMNKAAFMRAFNSIIAKLVGSKVEDFNEGRLWSRRYAEQVLPRDEDIEEYFFYCALNPILSGVSETIKDYELYNSFSDAISGKKREFKLLNRWKYNEDSRWNPKLKEKDYIEHYTLKFKRLPTYDKLTKDTYRKQMLEKIEPMRTHYVKKRYSEGKAFATRGIRKSMRPGTKPRYTKTSSKYGFTPLVLCSCKKTKYEFLELYFDTVNTHKEASMNYLAGDLKVEFPPGTYRPPAFNSPDFELLSAAA